MGDRKLFDATENFSMGNKWICPRERLRAIALEFTWDLNGREQMHN